MTDTFPMNTDTKAMKDIAAGLLFEGDPAVVFEDAARKEAEGKLQEMQYSDMKKLALAPGIGTQFSIADTVDPIYTPLAVGFARQLIEEYHCQTPSEIAMAEMAAVAYTNFVEYSKIRQTYRRDAAMHREIDRAYRRFVSSIAMLRHMKAPPVSVKIVADTAFVAQNQVNQTQKPYDAK